MFPTISTVARLAGLLALGAVFFMVLPFVMRESIVDSLSPEEVHLINVVAAANSWRASTNRPLQDMASLEGPFLAPGSFGGTRDRFLTNHFVTFPPLKIRFPEQQPGWIRAVGRKSLIDARNGGKETRALVVEQSDGRFDAVWKDEPAVKRILESSGESLVDDGRSVRMSGSSRRNRFAKTLAVAILFAAIVVLLLPAKTGT